jgi:hypothetical protein
VLGLGLLEQLAWSGELLSGFEPVERGLVNLAGWRPMCMQPPLALVSGEIAQLRVRGACCGRTDPAG